MAEEKERTFKEYKEFGKIMAWPVFMFVVTVATLTAVVLQFLWGT